MKFQLLVTYWTPQDELCGCDTVFLEEPIDPFLVGTMGFVIPAAAHRAIASLEDLENASLLFIAGYEIVGSNGK